MVEFLLGVMALFVIVLSACCLVLAAATTIIIVRDLFRGLLRVQGVEMGLMKDFDRRIRNGGDDAIAAVSELMPQWIPVSERLPEDGVRVLAWDRREECWRIAYLDTTWYMVGFDDDHSICVSHWQSLPEPPSP